jgi:hypothetical protein
MLTGIVQGYRALIACRVLLGALEGGMFPGLALCLTIFYAKRELALRIGYLFVSAVIENPWVTCSYSPLIVLESWCGITCTPRNNVRRTMHYRKRSIVNNRHPQVSLDN